MLKTAMLVSAFALSAPALAQQQSKPASDATTTAPADPQTAPATAAQDVTTPQDGATTAARGAPIPGAPVTAPAEQAAASAPQTTPATPTASAEVAAAATPAEPAAVTGATQIAQVVNTEFPTYDKNADTNLDKTEFGAWMVALKTASDPATKAGDPATVKWIDGAFASADADKSKSVSKAELTTYLSQGAG
jgi:hypothetical protein